MYVLNIKYSATRPKFQNDPDVRDLKNLRRPRSTYARYAATRARFSKLSNAPDVAREGAKA